MAVSRTPRESGGSMVPVLGVAMVLGLMAALLGWATAAGVRLIQTTREDLRASQIVMERAETLRLFTGSRVCDPSSQRKPLFVGLPSSPCSPNISGEVQYAAHLSAPRGWPDAQRGKLRTVTVTLSWTNCDGARPVVHERPMQAVLARNGAPKYLWGAL